MALDRDDAGEDQRWYARDLTCDGGADDGAGGGTVHLPGSLQEQGYGDEVTAETAWNGQVVDRSYYLDDRYAPYREPGKVAVPFWLQPRRYYRGAAWYQRTVQVPAAWAGRRVVLELERVHWESTLWVDERRVGSERSLCAPHRYDLGVLAPGEHRVTLRVDNRTVVDVGPNAHSTTDHTQGSWNGVVGRVALRARPDVVVRRVRVVPRVADRALTVRLDLAGGPSGVGAGRVVLTARRCDDLPGPRGPEPEPLVVDYAFDAGMSPRGLSATTAHLDVDLPLGDGAALWDEHSPALYALEVALEPEGRPEDRTVRRTVVGLREVSVVGTQIAVNGRPTFVRGTLECCVFPLTGYPPTDVASWARIVAVCRAHGLNLLRFHSWCPPEAAFRAADEAGMLLQVEGPVWANQGASLGEGGSLDAFVHEETRAVLDEFGDHPSFVVMAHGNEPSGRDAEFLGDWVTTWRRRDPRRLYTSGAGWPAIVENDLDNVSEPRLHRWDEGLGSRLNATPPTTDADYSAWVEGAARPVVSHEVGQWCAHPSFAERAKYTGLMQPRNLDVFADFLEQGGMGDQAEDFLHASGRLQLLCYKEEVEAALRTPGFGGFHLLGLSDFPGQGTALVGVLDAFWEGKGYCEPEEFARFCGVTTPLARLPRRVLAAGDDLVFEPQVAHFGAGPLRARTTWRVLTTDGGGGGEALGGDVVAEGVVPGEEVPVGNARRHDVVRVPLEAVGRAVAASGTGVRLRLELAVVDLDGGAEHRNDWDVWVFPAPAARRSDEGAAAGVVVTRAPDEAVRRADAGERVVLVPPAASLRDDVALGFTPVFWNTAWTKGQAPHTLGLVHDAQHPLFARFPSTGHTDWQWWEVLHGARAMQLEGLPRALRPVVQPIDTWFSARRLGLVVEMGVGDGALLVCSADVLDAPADRPAAAAFRDALLAYAAGPDFAPGVAVSATEAGRWLADVSVDVPE
ncbi:glycoside hydrolase [Pseudokineococcus marinus]|uniref:Glycoside hydrolase n=2 Tax=Pseudokineococcus marinus TaxID=351215 RepID=A0A849BVI9_9ACTN|nr:glycoside hydrolase [Pseudokineococcus marinus]